MMNLPPHVCTDAERAILVAAAEVYWASMASIIDGDTTNAGADPQERASMIAHMAQQGLLGMAVREVGGLAVGVMINSCGRMVGQVLSQAPNTTILAKARAHLEQQIMIGADDFLAVSPT